MRSAEILRQYADANPDFLDALIVATAERLNIKRLLTLESPRLPIDPSKALHQFRTSALIDSALLNL